MPELSDVLIIGSGPAGAHAALALCEAGKTVTILDGGNDAPAILSNTETRDFPALRREARDQWKLLLGEDFSNIPVSGLSGGLGGGMASGNRAYATRDTATALPTSVENGQVIQSLAKGGLGAVWGATSAYLSTNDLQAMGIPPAQMQENYDAVTQKIGISGPGTQAHVQPPALPDHHAAAILRASVTKAQKLKNLCVKVMQPMTAILTKDLGTRKASRLQDLDYYCDPGKSVYRPQYTIEELRTNPNVSYIGGVVVDRIEETDEGCVVFGHTAGDPIIRRWSAKKVIVAAGAVNSARILLRSLSLFDTPVSFVTKPHVFIPCLHRPALGKAGPDRRMSLCQIVAVDETPAMHNVESACAQLYSYRSMLLFRLLSALPLPVPQAMSLLALLSPALVIADVRFPGLIRRDQTLSLSREGMLNIVCKPERSNAETMSLKRIRKALKTVGLTPLKTMNLPEGSTSHYAGTVPVSNDETLPLSATPDGRVRQMQNVYVADAALFRMLPPLPHTLTIMANARRIGQVVALSL